MRRVQQKHVLELLDTVGQAQAAGLYADCQNGALAVGSFIESVEAKPTKTVALLEAYCELLYGASRGRIPKDALQKHLRRVVQSVADELKPRLEIVFFPYKASMADSFETVFRAARADPCCDVYWVPIPYFERNKDGSFGTVYYEGGEYPGDIEVTDWREYDVTLRRPDIAFIHNPYDAFNHVSSVHPNYYSDALRPHVGFLVYIDYGIPCWFPLDPSQPPGAHANRVPCYEICDLHVAFSEVYARYLKYCLLHAPQRPAALTDEVIDGKVVALGSPKFDKLLRAKREDYVLPQAWQTAIGDKKILLYNTSITEILRSEEKSLDQIRRVIAEVAGREDIMLWWRPHPLSVSAMASMRPQLVDEYLAIVSDYEKRDDVIYDETPDYHRAIAWSDACLTNYSSLMWLYLASGKPFTVLAQGLSLPPLEHERLENFFIPLRQRIYNMSLEKGANRYHYNSIIWWNNFLPENIPAKKHYDNFLPMFIDFIVHRSRYRENAETYAQMQTQMYRDFVASPDGTAGKAIFEFCKERVLTKAD